MDIGRITAEEVRNALECVRQARPVKGSPLLEMDALRVRLRQEGISVSAESLEWTMGQFLEEVIWTNLSSLRGDRSPGSRSAVAMPEEKLLLARDFAQDNIELETWSSLYYWYMSQLGLQQREIAAIARPGYEHGVRHIQRRTVRGFQVLERLLRQLEHEATRAADVRPSTRSLRLPSGTFTFLCVDIESVPQPDAVQFSQVLGEFDALVTDIVSRFSGTVAKARDGDSSVTVAYFRSAKGAVGAAVELQSTLLEDAVLASVELAARAALCTGEVDLCGTIASRCLRLNEIAHGRQIIASETTAAVVRAALPPNIELRDLGPHALKDLAHPERIYQVAHSSLPQNFPPLRSLRAFPNNLPAQLSGFVGREEECQRLRRLLLQKRLVTVTGPAGIGKTRLAIQVAAEVIEAFTDGVWLVDLANVEEPDLVLQAVASTHGIQEVPGDSLMDAVLAFLHPKHLLVVFDNCEHVIETCAVLADTLLRTCPGLRILATSREALQIPGEQECPLMPLAVPEPGSSATTGAMQESDAVTLFAERAREAAPAFRLSDQDVPAVVHICRQLDGIPLAIELAAARARTLTLDQILNRLDDRLGLLSHGSRVAASRHRTLRAAIDWSYDLLSKPERQCLRRLAVFRGGWSLEAAEVVCTGDAVEATALIDLLGALVGKSLVVVDEGPLGKRYRMLKTIRQYGLERLEAAGDSHSFRTRHFAWAHGLATQAESELHGPRQKVWFGRLDVEHDNLLAALDWCKSPQADVAAGLELAAALLLLWQTRGFLRTGRDRLVELLGMSSDAAPLAVRACALRAAGVLTYFLGEFAEARVFYEESLEIQHKLGDEESAAALYDNLGIVAQGQGDYAGARSFHEKSKAIHTQQGNERGIVRALINQGTLAYWQDDDLEAERCFEEALARSRSLGDNRCVAPLLGNLGNLAWRRGDLTVAEKLLEESLSLRRELGDKRGVSHCLAGLGSVAHRRGDHAAALAFFTESLAINREFGDQLGVVAGLNSLGTLAYDQADYEAARSRFCESLRIASDAGARPHVVECLELIATLAHALGNSAHAVELFGAAGTLRGALGIPLRPEDCEVQARHLDQLKTSMSREGFTSEWEAGKAMDWEQAVFCALGEAER